LLSRAGLEQAGLVAHVVKRLSPRKIVELRADGQQRIVGALLSEVLAVVAAQVRQDLAAAAHLKARSPEQQFAQLAARPVAPGTVAAQPPQPRARLGVRAGPRTRCAQPGAGNDVALSTDANSQESLD